eukprot:gene34659-46522_t
MSFLFGGAAALARGSVAAGQLLGGELVRIEIVDPDDAVDAALAQLDESAKKMPTLFPESTKGMKPEGDYSSSPKVWEDKAGFDAKIASFAKVITEAKSKIKDLDSLKANVGGIGKECGSCHETYRVKI